MTHRFSAVFLGRYEAPYDQCPACGLLQVRAPHWLDEAHGDAIAVTDTGLVARNLNLADRLAILLPALDGGKGPYLDYGGGLGLFVRLMRDRGFDFRWHDPYARNELARGFEYDPARGPCSAVTAFEVFEHTVDPRSFVESALAAGGADTLIFSTEPYTGDLPPQDWWYYSRETGQHISFVRRATLEQLANQLDLTLLSHGSLHVLTRRALDPRRFQRACSSRLLRLWSRIRRSRASLTQADHAEMVSRLAARQQAGEL